MNVSIAEAKAKFSELIKRAEAGEEIIVTRHGKAVATIAAPPKADTTRASPIGAMKGIWIWDDFDELGPEWDDYIK
ncbi:prevent-host-death family protein [Aminobacter aminovorans]|uniref:Antitoxin n=1 Tax=Aminobacter aminovorans TaxID=83263 RepID=A0A380WR25_AMIAI|nr:type II toxin-antitoxin system prevent-host-death family antitoxin [Aminobacter aminovorans]TCS29745.1 prevent-host-death family protein [Aminobacter aminovorans]SUU90594.1 Antitoxin of toxin-antitoxin stability system [Aminobacter aminovorans]